MVAPRSDAPADTRRQPTLVPGQPLRVSEASREEPPSDTDAQAEAAEPPEAGTSFVAIDEALPAAPPKRVWCGFRIGERTHGAGVPRLALDLGDVASGLADALGYHGDHAERPGVRGHATLVVPQQHVKRAVMDIDRAKWIDRSARVVAWIEILVAMLRDGDSDERVWADQALRGLPAELQQEVDDRVGPRTEFVGDPTRAVPAPGTVRVHVRSLEVPYPRRFWHDIGIQMSAHGWGRPAPAWNDNAAFRETRAEPLDDTQLEVLRRAAEKLPEITLGPERTFEIEPDSEVRYASGDERLRILTTGTIDGRFAAFRFLHSSLRRGVLHVGCPEWFHMPEKGTVLLEAKLRVGEGERLEVTRAFLLRWSYTP